MLKEFVKLGGGFGLAGRYLQFHFYPFTIGEIFALSIGIKDVGILTEIPEQSAIAQEAWETMFQISGFPEAWLKNQKSTFMIIARFMTRLYVLKIWLPEKVE